MIQISTHKRAVIKKLREKVEYRTRQELAKLNLEVNELKTRIVHLDKDEDFEFLGFNFRLVKRKADGALIRPKYRPSKKKRVELIRKIRNVLKKNRFMKVEDVISEHLNPIIRGWVNYFRVGTSSRDLNFVKWQVENMVRRFATRQTPKKRGGTRWTKWKRETIYNQWGLHSNYRVKRIPQVT